MNGSRVIAVKQGMIPVEQGLEKQGLEKKAMRRALPIAAWIFPLLVAAAIFKFDPRSEQLGPILLGSVALGWAGLAFGELRRLWLKVVLVVSYPLLMWIGITAVMIAVYGVPGL
jgi:hypothetical protein